MSPLFRRKPPGPAAAGGRVAREKSGAHIVSSDSDWVPEDVQEAERKANTGPVQPQDWLPPGLPERTSDPPTSARKRSTVRELPPEQQVEELRRERRELQRELEEARAELEATREQAPFASAPAHEHDASPVSDGVRININTAGVAELMRLPGVGERAAQRIIELREERGPFRALGGLLAVEGFHPDRIRRLADHATV